ncbi:MAG: asparagine--tRNA ligase [Betaproteobacteria bacterium]|nr:asparagine--tRNA ligase [Betaproteobacteria bacterium]
MSTAREALTTIADIHAERVALGKVTIAGWVRTRRGSKKFSFLEVNDGTSGRSLQVVIDGSLPNYEAEILALTTGASVRVEGQLVSSPGQGQKFELQASSVKVYGLADPEKYPLQKKDMTYEYLRDVAHLRGRTATFAGIFRIRARVSQAIHRFFSDNGFYYIHSPLLTTSDAEGAGETFQVTTLPLAQPPRTATGGIDYSKDFFGAQAMLCVTGQLEAEALALGLGKVYTFGPTFRAENSNTSRHLSEFWMIEPEMAFYELEDNMTLAQDMIRYVVKDVLDHCADDLENIVSRNGVETREYLRMALERPFVRVTYTEAVDILKASGRTFEYPVEWGEDLKSEHERYLCEEHFKAPTIVYNYPSVLKAFYMYQNDDGKTVRAMDLLMPGIGEVIGGSQREDREHVLLEKMKTKGIPSEHLEWYIDLRRFGGVPHSGFGLGLERLLVWITGMGNVRDVIPFPRVPGVCKF